jgi:hypothetical protein
MEITATGPLARKRHDLSDRNDQRRRRQARRFFCTHPARWRRMRPVRGAAAVIKGRAMRFLTNVNRTAAFVFTMKSDP